MKESPIQRLILDWLAAERILAFRMNTGVAKFDTRFVRFGVKGMADILSFPKLYTGCRACGDQWKDTAVVWIETKRPDGKQSPEQKSFQQQVEEDGHIYILARSLEDVQRVIGR